MTAEQLLIERWRNLSAEKQQEVLDFVEFLYKRQANVQIATPTPNPTQSFLGNRLRQLRQQIVDSGVPLLNESELEAEIASRRGGFESHVVLH